MHYDGTFLELRAAATPIRHALRMWVWRWKTRLRLSWPPTRAYWRQRFSTEPCLYSARWNVDYRSMAGVYNEIVPGGFMTEDQARRIMQGVRLGPE